MNSQMREEAGFTIIDLDGEIDFHQSPELREAILDGLGRGRPLLVDLTRVSYIDSSGIACLVEGLQHAKGQELEFGLVGPQETAMQVLRLTRLDQVFSIHTSVAERLNR